jgi:hypothetical protein
MVTPSFLHRVRGVFTLALLSGLLPLAAEDLNVPPVGFRALFNGENLDGWWGAATEDPRDWMALAPDALAEKKTASLGDIQQHWSVEDGILVNGGEGLYLTSDEHFGDYELRLEYKTVAGADSGIYLKGYPQVQIWDTTEAGGKWEHGADKGSGGLWNNSPGQPGKDPLVHADRPLGEWNTFRIVQCGARTWVWLNHELVVDGAILENYFDEARKIPIAVRGPIQLQTHGGEIRWRNVFVRDIEPAEANRRLSERAAAGFEPIFNGRNLSGWQGATDAYDVVDGMMVGRASAGGALFTRETYADFRWRVEFKLPSGGNNGLAIRYPGQGNPAYTGMAELQVLDNSGPKYQDLDARQYHGSAYGMVPAFRGYLREVGEWNFQEVTVRGSTIVVELNGNVILNTDLAEATDFFQDKPHPGRHLTEGHLGLAGHRSPVAFRNLAVKRLP